MKGKSAYLLRALIAIVLLLGMSGMFAPAPAAAAAPCEPQTPNIYVCQGATVPSGDWNAWLEGLGTIYCANTEWTFVSITVAGDWDPNTPGNYTYELSCSLTTGTPPNESTCYCNTGGLIIVVAPCVP